MGGYIVHTGNWIVYVSTNVFEGNTGNVDLGDLGECKNETGFEKCDVNLWAVGCQ
jgi:hypothetical protein